MRPMLMPISCAATRFSATARMAIPVGLKRKNEKRTVIKTSVTRKISAFSWLTTTVPRWKGVPTTGSGKVRIS